jgi:hypothetical protein
VIGRFCARVSAWRNHQGQRSASVPLYRLNESEISPVTQTSFPQLRFRERDDLQRLLRMNIEVISPQTLIIAEEFGEWSRSQRRIDLLGIDKEANLVVIELKRTDDGAHMDLQAIRYAAMVARMTFDEASAAYSRFLDSEGSEADARREMLKFLGWTDPADGEFARNVRIILAAGDFSPEITSTVLWLNERDLDITCVRLRPYQLGEQILLGVEQIIPLPEAADYQVQIRNKAREDRATNPPGGERIRYKLVLGEQTLGPLLKRYLVLELVRYLVSSGKTPEELIAATGRGNLWAVEEGFIVGEEFRARLAMNHPGIDARYPQRYFTADDQLFHIGPRTYALINQWGTQTVPTMERLLAAFPEQPISFSVHDSVP